MKTRIVGLACAVLLVLSVRAAHADPIAITSGRIATDFDGIDTFYLNTAAFTLSMYYVPENVHMPAALTQGSYGGYPVFAFQLGQPLDFSATITGIFRESLPGNPTVSMTLDLAADPVRVTSIPAPPPGLPVSLVPIQTPFRMTGIGEGQQILFTGAGTLTSEGVIFAREPGRLTFSPVDWRFSSPTSSPTPEPASMLLLGTGIVGLLVRRSRVR